MVASFLTKALVPSILLSAQYALAEGSCSKVDNVKFTFFGLGSAGVYTKFGCSGTSVTSGSESATAENAPHPSGGIFFLLSAHPKKTQRTKNNFRRRLLQQSRPFRNRPRQPQIQEVRNYLPSLFQEILPVRRYLRAMPNRLQLRPHPYRSVDWAQSAERLDRR